ncbi:MAG TPA: bifunctional 4-hydroxy-2-oxoglutarate aldolase/2-dehydro-3-deoxy-phosphogluconate aldolase [Solirubrobacteraceae bacterium]|nr:bifunctional 4-hydroxy-2-oxoglutarate aldolase/2-dehydro-3-deoxy-phosphogluconate aldolase [Solirubrobacteraceae bacterium]
MTPTIEAITGAAPVVPVVVIEDAADGVPLARALVAGGLPAVEVTLRTPGALEALERIAAEVPDAIVGAGTVLSGAQADAAVAAGASFLVSPGTTPALLDAMAGSGVPFLPGAATASDVVALVERGVSVAKFFPAEAAGGVAALRALAGPFPDVRFCPTGGIDLRRAPEYLALPNVVCVGGSWMVPKDAARAGDWAAVEELARAAAALREPASAAR